MVEIINYLRARYMSEKAQGITEYALILAFVAVIAGLVLNNSTSQGLAGALKAAFNSVITKLGGTVIP